MQVTIDSSVIVASLKKDEERHKICRRIMEKVKNGDFIAIESYIVLVEVVAAIKRRTGSAELAEKIRGALEAMDTIYFLELTKSRATEAAEIAEQTGVRGMDAIIVQAARENGTALITLDREMAERVKDVVKVAEPETLLDEGENIT
jgi:predicted nucleic acid-binding protein